jgi:hypothetical protein
MLAIKIKEKARIAPVGLFTRSDNFESREVNLSFSARENYLNEARLAVTDQIYRMGEH